MNFGLKYCEMLRNVEKAPCLVRGLRRWLGFWRNRIQHWQQKASLKVHRVSSTGFENVLCWCSLLQDAILIQEYSSGSISATSNNQFYNQLNILLKDHDSNIFQLIHCIHSNLKSHNPSCSFGTPLRRALFEVSRHSTQGRLKKRVAALQRKAEGEESALLKVGL